MRAFHLVVAGVALSASAFSLPEQLPMADVSDPISTSESWQWLDCGLDDDPVRIESIQISPDPPQPGKNLTVTVIGIAHKRIEDGAYVGVTVKFGLVKFMQRRFDVCEEARSANASIQCPVEPGTYTIEQTVALPKEIPRAKVTVLADGYTADDEDMLCLQLKVDFMKRPFLRIW